MAHDDERHDVDWQDVARRLADIARDLPSQNSEQTTLDRIAECPVDLLDGYETAEVLVIRSGQVSTLAATDNVARARDRPHGELHEGPCFDAARDRHQVRRIADLTTTGAIWPRFAPRAHALGIGSVMSFLLFTTGANNLQPSGSIRQPIRADRADAGLTRRSRSACRQNDARLRDALRTSRVIGEAIGIIMAGRRLDSSAAFAVLSQISQNSNVKVREVADRTLRKGAIPED